MTGVSPRNSRLWLLFNIWIPDLHLLSRFYSVKQRENETIMKNLLVKCILCLVRYLSALFFVCISPVFWRIFSPNGAFRLRQRTCCYERNQKIDLKIVRRRNFWWLKGRESSTLKNQADSAVRWSLHPTFKIRTDSAACGFLHTSCKIPAYSAVRRSLHPP